MHAHIPYRVYRRLADAELHMSIVHGARGRGVASDLRNQLTLKPRTLIYFRSRIIQTPISPTLSYLDDRNQIKINAILLSESRAAPLTRRRPYKSRALQH